MAARIELDYEDFAQHFESLDDPRSDINQRHQLGSIIMISIMAILAGAGGPTSIAVWANNKKEWLQKILSLPNGIPQKDVYRRVLSSLKPQAFQKCFAQWMQALVEHAQSEAEVKQLLLNIDGKTVRRSHDRAKDLGALHSVTAWAGEYGLTLAQVACEEKSNEITAIPELLKLVDIAGTIVTIDAMGTQKAIAKQIVEGGADYILALKGNQGTLHNAVIEYVDEHLETNFKGTKARKHITKEKGHGRKEERTYWQMPVPDDFAQKELWKGLQTIGIAISKTIRNGKESSEIRYFISSLPMGVKVFSHAIRGHWSIENSCHWSLDFTYREDESRIREVTLRENFAWLYRFTLGLLKQHPSTKSLVMKRRIWGWNETFLLEVLTTTTT